jgi:hypothetical protein
MTDTTMAGAGEFSVGRVFSRAFELLFRDFAKFLLLGGIAWLPFLVLTLVGIGAVNAKPTKGNLVAFAVTAGLTALLMLALQVLSQAVVLYGAFQQMRGQSFAIGESLSRGLTRFLPILGMLIIMGIAMGLAAILLVFPALILATMWYVALPVCVVEKEGPTGSLSRSSALTSGNRWKIFGIYLVIAVANGIGQNVVGFVFGLGGFAIGIIGTFAWLAIAGVYQSIVVAVVYHDLRVAKEGIDIDRIAAVFE